MRLSLHTVILAGPPDLEGQLAVARDAGYEGLDIGIDEVAALPDAREPFERYGIEPASWMLPVRWQGNENEFAEDLDTLPRICQTAQVINCPRCVTYIPPTVPGDPDEFRSLVVRRFGQMADIMGEYGVRFGLEWIGPWHARQEGNIFIYTMPDILDLVADIGRPNVGLLLDSWHWYMAGGTICELEQLKPEQIVHVHFVDAPDRPYEEQRDGEREIPGQGIIDLVGFVRALNKIGYADFAVVEVFGDELPKLPPLEAATKVKVACDAILAEACRHRAG